MTGRILEFLLTRPHALIPSEIVLLALLEEGIGRRDAACERMALLIRRMSGLSPGWEEKGPHHRCRDGLRARR